MADWYNGKPITTYRAFNRAPKHKREAMRIAQLRHQDGQCALCPRTVTPADRYEFAVDHCHATDLLRGLLCASCNAAMAAVDRGDEWLERARAYRDGGVWAVTGCVDHLVPELAVAARQARRKVASTSKSRRAA